MSSINTEPKKIITHEGGVAKHITPLLELRRSVLSTLLWEKQFYEEGEDIAARIKRLIPLVDPVDCLKLAIEARVDMKLRHVPLLIAREMARLPKHKCLASTAISGVIQRPDELTEFLAIYWKEKKQPLSAQVKKGLAEAFRKFSEYQLAKYNRDNAVKLRDVLFLCHAKPQNDAQELVWKKLVDGTLEAPDTWEVALSAGKDKKETWERLMREGKLGALALLRNLRNMNQVGVDERKIVDALETMDSSRVLPYRFIAAAKHAVYLEPHIEKAMLKLQNPSLIKGRTILLIDVSSSMDAPLSAKSDLYRADAASGLAILAREMFEGVAVYTFSNHLIQVPARRGFALRDAIKASQYHSGTQLGEAVRTINHKFDYDRIIVITDEQTADRVPDPKGKAYVINVASSKNGVGYGKWTHIDGFSESVLTYIQEYEKL